MSTSWCPRYGGDLLGRCAALNVWGHVLAGAERGRGAVVDLVGEPGIGKTRLLEAFAEQALACGLSVTSESFRPAASDRPCASPRVLLLDNAGRARGGSSQAAVQLLRPGLPDDFVVVVARRPYQSPPQLLRALDSVGARRIVLEGLPGEDLGRLGADRVCEPHRCRALGESGGNPEYVKILAGLCGGPQACAGGPLPDPDVPLPADAAGMLADFDGLRASTTLVGHAAAVVGGSFDPELLAAVARMPQDEVLEGIDQLLTTDLVRLVGSTGQLRFRNLMAQWVLYAATPGGWRFGAHLRALAVLRERGEPADACAVHVERTGRVGDLGSVAALVDAARLTAGGEPHAARYWYSAALLLLPEVAAHASLRDELNAERERIGTRVADFVNGGFPAEGSGALCRIPPDDRDHARSDLDHLSGREQEVAVLVSRGRTNQQIARALGVSHKTVETHLKRIFTKLAVCSRAEVAKLVGRTEVGRDAVAS